MKIFIFNSESVLRAGCLPTVLILSAAMPGVAPAQNSTAPATFSSPSAAAKALIAAAKKCDAADLDRIYGPDGSELTSSADPVQFQNGCKIFVNRAKAKMHLDPDPKDPAQEILTVGTDQWPLPIPIVKVSGKWQFDAKQGVQELLDRRIGANELSAIEMERGFVEAEVEYASVDRKGNGIREYAQKFFSSPGKHDGLYWPSTGPDDESPAGEAVAKAIAEGYVSKDPPFHGYYFRILKEQGPDAVGGAYSYIQDGVMTKGFAMLAWPAEHGSTGIMTFMVGTNGLVLQKNLGKDTDSLARAINAYNPDRSWQPVID